jgi:hypothetical protein
MSQRPDAIYWRRATWHQPYHEIIEPENCWFYPGKGPCVDGYYWWISRPVGPNKKVWVKRMPLEIWRQYGRKVHSPPEEHTEHRGIRLEFFLSEKGLEA